MKIYHYTSFSKIGGILGKWPGEVCGLEPRSSIGLPFSGLDLPKAVFGLLEPSPENWVNNPHFPVTWRKLIYNLQVMNHDGAVLLEVEVDGLNDKAFVAEEAHIEGYLYVDKANIPNEFLHESQREAEEAYLGSMISINEYVEKHRAEGWGYSLPEVVVLNPIPFGRIAVSSQQPLLEDDLASRSGERNYLIQLITRGYAHHELGEWRRNYEAKNGPLEQQMASRERW